MGDTNHKTGGCSVIREDQIITQAKAIGVQFNVGRGVGDENISKSLHILNQIKFGKLTVTAVGETPTGNVNNTTTIGIQNNIGKQITTNENKNSWQDKIQSMNIGNVTVTGAGIGIQNNINYLENPPEKNKLPKKWNVPLRNKNFTSRTKIFEDIEDQLTKNEYVILCGLGGIGKTAIVLEYVHRHYEHFAGGVAWFESANFDQLIANYCSLAIALNIPLQQYNNVLNGEEKAMKVKDWLEEKTGWLLVYNNANNFQEIESLIPNNEGGKIICTSRFQAGWPEQQCDPIEVQVFSEPESLEFIHKILNISGVVGSLGDDELESKQLAETLGNLPLALTQACFYIKYCRTMTISKYLVHYNRTSLEKQAILKALPAGISQSVYITWDITVVKIKEENERAYDWLQICACFAPDKIQSFLLEYFVSPDYRIALSDSFNNDGTISLGGEGAWNVPEFESLDGVDIRSLLTNYSMVNIVNENGDISIHRLVQEVSGLKWDFKNAKTFTWSALLVLSKSFSFEESIFDIRRKQELSPHMSVICNQLKELRSNLVLGEKSQSSTRQILRLYKLGFELLSSCLNACGNIKCCIDALETTFFDDALEGYFSNSDRTYILKNMGNMYSIRGCNEYAKELLKLSLESDSKNSLERACCQGDIGSICAQLEQFEEAEEFLTEALNIYRGAGEESLPDVADTLVNLSVCLNQMGQVSKGRASEAVRHAQEAIRIMDLLKVDPTHPTYIIAKLQLNKANVAAGNLKDVSHIEGESLLESTNEFSAILLAEEGRTLIETGDYTKATKYLEKALTILKQAGNDNWLDVAVSLASVWCGTADTIEEREKAFNLLDEVLPLYKNKYGSDTLKYGILLGVKGQVMLGLKKLEDSRFLLEESIKIKKYNFGGNMERTVAVSLQILGDVYNKLGLYDLSREVLSEALQINKLIFNDANHTFVALNMLDLGKIGDDKCLSEKYNMLKWALETLEKNNYPADGLIQIRKAINGYTLTLESNFLEFFNACQEGDLVRFQKGLSTGIDLNVNMSPEIGNSLYRALIPNLKNDRIDDKNKIVKLLLENGALVRKQNDNPIIVNSSVLFAAIQYGCNDTILLILNKLKEEFNQDTVKISEYLNRLKFEGRTLFSLAELRGHDIVQILNLYT